MQKHEEDINDKVQARRAEILDWIQNKKETNNQENIEVYFVDSKGSIASKNQFLLHDTPADNQFNQLKADMEKEVIV